MPMQKLTEQPRALQQLLKIDLQVNSILTCNEKRIHIYTNYF